MGSRTPSPEASREQISDLPVEQASQDCPLDRKGDIRVVVRWLHDNKPVSGVPVTLTGPTPGKGTTDGQGQVTFKKRKPGGYNYAADFSTTQARMPVEVVKRDRVSAVKDKLTTVTAYIEELGAIEIAVKEKDGDTVLGLVPQDCVLSVSGGNKSEKNVNERRFERVRAGEVTITVEVKQPEWKLLPDQDQKATVKPGETVRKEIYAERRPWITVKLKDKDSGALIEKGALQMKHGQQTRTADLKAAQSKHHFAKSDGKPSIDHVETTEGETDDPWLYEFVSLS